MAVNLLLFRSGGPRTRGKKLVDPRLLLAVVAGIDLKSGDFY
ncbi:hypothetical protein PLANPX_3768 [Lacipirellula parvula]|uniref:Uncharacterized protein n=1 Tax=Lacipirellula parvula TaxID=2650471 RepID=A0A5K7XIK1_9BACT|nr:hypothetical protein PLANPX_3768 [Lacipirellula parvula]